MLIHRRKFRMKNGTDRKLGFSVLHEIRKNANPKRVIEVRWRFKFDKNVSKIGEKTQK